MIDNIDNSKNYKDHWYVETIDSNKNNPKVPHITFYDPSNYDYKIGVDVGEIKAKHEIFSHFNNGNQVNNLKLERVVLHEAICNISLNYQVTDKTLPDLALKVQESALKIANSMKDNVQWSNYADTKYLVTRYIAGDLKSDSPEYIALKDLEKRFDELLKKHQEGKIKLYNQKDMNYFTNDNKKTILADMYYNIQQQQLKDALAEKAVQEAIDGIEEFKQLKKLTYHESNTRKSCLVVGGAACGKGSLTLMVEKFIMKG